VRATRIREDRLVPSAFLHSSRLISRRLASYSGNLHDTIWSRRCQYRGNWRILLTIGVAVRWSTSQHPALSL